MLFRKKIAPYCAYCVHAGTIDREKAICAYKGIVDNADSCRRFKYDPLRRVPSKPAALNTKGFSEDDFKI